jgi:hypothetical protein
MSRFRYRVWKDVRWYWEVERVHRDTLHGSDFYQARTDGAALTRSRAVSAALRSIGRMSRDIERDGQRSSARWTEVDG